MKVGARNSSSHHTEAKVVQNVLSEVRKSHLKIHLRMLQCNIVTYGVTMNQHKNQVRASTCFRERALLLICMGSIPMA